MAAIPALSNAAIQAVQDVNVRTILRSLADFVAVRNGDTGDGKDAFLTLADLTKDGAKAAGLAKALAKPISAGINNPNTPLDELNELGRQLENRILSSAAWQDMFSRLDLIAAPDFIPGSIAWQVLSEAKARGAAITKVSEQVQSTALSFAKSVETMTAALNDNAAAIRTETQVRVDANTAMAKRIDTMAVTVGQNTVGMQNETSLRTNSDNALADAINTMWARFGANGALVQSGTGIAVNNVGSTVTKFEQLQATVTDPATGLVAKSAALRTDLNVTNDVVAGMKGKWGVKIDLNGYVTGVALNSGVSTGGKAESSFIVLADTFAVGAPGKAGIVPFAIDAQTGLVAIRGDLVVKHSIGADHLVANSITANSGVIADLAVSTLKLANNAVTVPYVGTSYGVWNGIGRGVWMTVCRGTIWLDIPGMVFASSSGYINYGRGWVEAFSQLVINGSVVSSGGGAEAWVNATHSGGLMCGAGYVTVELMFWGLDDRVRINNPTIFIMGAKR